jgi:hypothetical protein
VRCASASEKPLSCRASYGRLSVWVSVLPGVTPCAGVRVVVRIGGRETCTRVGLSRSTCSGGRFVGRSPGPPQLNWRLSMLPSRPTSLDVLVSSCGTRSRAADATGIAGAERGCWRTGRIGRAGVLGRCLCTDILGILSSTSARRRGCRMVPVSCPWQIFVICAREAPMAFAICRSVWPASWRLFASCCADNADGRLAFRERQPIRIRPCPSAAPAAHNKFIVLANRGSDSLRC